MRDFILSQIKPQVQSFHIESWGKDCHMRVITAREREQLERYAKADPPDMEAKMVAMVLCDADGARLFTDEEADKLLDLPHAQLRELADKAYNLNFQKKS